LNGSQSENRILVGWDENGYRLPETYVSGSLSRWQQYVASRCRDHPHLMLAVSLAFAGPLLRLLVPDPVFHFVSPDTGEPNARLAVAGSVVGGSGPDRLVRRWDPDSAAVEAILQLYSDTTLVVTGLDEGGLERLEHTWRVRARDDRPSRGVLLSSGDRPLPFRHELLNLLVRDSPGNRELVAATRRDYGWAFRHFIEHLVRQNQVELMGKLHTELDNFAAFYPGAPFEVDHFGLAAFAGELASAWQITSWQVGAANRAAHDCCLRWVESLSGDEPYD
jgi:uncharacterized protein (DUF927 family)